MIDLEANQHMNKMVNIVIGQGVFKNNFRLTPSVFSMVLSIKER